MFFPTFEKARDQAVSLAKYFGVPYGVFLDTAGNYRVVKWKNRPKHVDMIISFHPATK